MVEWLSSRVVGWFEWFVWALGRPTVWEFGAPGAPECTQ